MLKKQSFYFLLIGGLASLANFILVFTIVHLGLAKPLVANFFAFMIAFSVSYFGHRFLTFSTTTQSHRKAGTQFFINALIGLALNEIIYYILLHIVHIQYLIALFITMAIVSVYTFIVIKFFIFKA